MHRHDKRAPDAPPPLYVYVSATNARDADDSADNIGVCTVAMVTVQATNELGN
jgi:hypothetical protein